MGDIIGQELVLGGQGNKERPAHPATPSERVGSMVCADGAGIGKSESESKWKRIEE